MRPVHRILFASGVAGVLFVIMLIVLGACSTANNWRTPAPPRDTRMVTWCETRGVIKECWNVTESEAREMINRTLAKP